MEEIVALVETGNSIHEENFIDPGLVIATRELLGIADFAQAFEVNAFDVVVIFDIESCYEAKFLHSIQMCTAQAARSCQRTWVLTGMSLAARLPSTSP